MDGRRESLGPLHRRAVENRFTAMECMAAAAAMAMVGRVPCGAYFLGPEVLGRIVCGELNPEMYSKDIVAEKGGWPDA